MKTSNCNCHGSQVTVADVCEGSLELPRYFPRQLLTPAELTLEQQYFRTRLRRHNLYMHGWGVVCGAEVCRVPDDTRPAPWKVRVKPGYILGAQGDEIFLSTEQEVDLRTMGMTVGSEDPDDVWCTPVFVERSDRVPSSLFVAVRYKEIPSRPVRVQPSGCGCDDSQCELSRLRDGFEIGILTELPASHQGDPPRLEHLFEGPIPACPECPTSPWVVLARIDLDPDGTIKLIDNSSCRRIVLSAADLWWRATEILLVTPDVVSPDNPFDLDITMSRELSAPILIDFGDPLVTAERITIEGKIIHVHGNAASQAAQGPRTITIKDSTGRVLAVREKALTIYLPESSETLMPMRMAAPEKPKPAPRKGRPSRK